MAARRLRKATTTLFLLLCIGLAFASVSASKPSPAAESTDAAAADEVRSFKLEYNPFTALTFFCIALSLVVASSSGIGGGGILVPIYILMLGAPGKVAIPLSNITILGGGIGNNVFNLSKRHPLKDRPMIDYDTVIMLEPLTIFGAVFGSFANKVLPDFVLILLLAVSLALTAYRTMGKGLKAWAKETEMMALESPGGSERNSRGGEKKASDSKGNFQRLNMNENDEDDDVAEEEAIARIESSQGRGDEELARSGNGAGNGEGGHQTSNGEHGGDDYGNLPVAEEGEAKDEDEDLESDPSSLQTLREWVASEQTEPHARKQAQLADAAELGAARDLSIVMSAKEIKHAGLAIIEGQERHHPLWKIGFLVSCFIGVMIMDYMKDIQECGTTPFWVWAGLVIPWTFAYTLAYRHYLMKRHALKLKLGYEFVEGDVMWGPRETILYPICCTAAGVLAGLFGVGGGMIKGPLVLEMGLTPVQAHATGMFMILFTSGSACITFYFFGQLNMEAGSVLFFMGIMCTAFGQKMFDIIMHYNKRQSIIVLCMGTVITLSAFLLTARSVIDAYGRLQNGQAASLYSFGTLCAIDE